MTIAILSIVHALEAVDDEEEGLTGVSLAKFITLAQQRGNMGFLAYREAVTELEAFDDQLHLEERFLSRVEEGNPSGSGNGIGQGEGHRGLTRPGLTGKEGDHGRRKALAAQGAIDIVEAGLKLVPELFRHLDIEDVLTEGDSVIGDVELHVFSFG